MAYPFSYHSLIHTFPKDRISTIKQELQSRAHITPTGCWERPSAYRSCVLEGHLGTYNQWCSLMKYGRVLERCNLVPVLCRNKSCFNPDHNIIPALESSATLAAFGKAQNKEHKFYAEVLKNEEIVKEINKEAYLTTTDIDPLAVVAPVAAGFNDKMLAAAVHRLSVVAVDVIGKLDKCSADIEELEKHLQEFALSTPYKLAFNLDVSAKDRLYTLEALAWENHEKGKMRLMLHYRIESGDIEKRPLIQLPAMVRLAASGLLPSFVNYIIENY